MTIEELRNRLDVLVYNYGHLEVELKIQHWSPLSGRYEDIFAPLEEDQIELDGDSRTLRIG